MLCTTLKYSAFKSPALFLKPQRLGFGAEGVRDALNLTLGALISTVERHGGDVLRIAGDALIVLFHRVRVYHRLHKILPPCDDDSGVITFIVTLV